MKFISDRRLTWTNKKIDDDANKVICATCADAYFTIGYAGLAMIGSKTDNWLVDYLVGIKINELQLISIAEKLKDEITRRISLSRIDKINKGITFVFCGFKENIPFILHISNIENENTEPLSYVDDVFHVGAMYKRKDSKPEYTPMIDYHGTEPAMIQPILTRINNLAREKCFHQNSDEVIAQELVDIIREAAQTPRYGKYIGRNCMAVIVLPPGSEQSFKSIYFPDQASPEEFAPHLILGGSALKDIKIWTGSNPPPWWKS
ncbi:MAG: hypothetical protein WA109_06045 [Bellilinea sp.]